MAQNKESAAASEVMAAERRRFRPIAPKPMPQPPLMPIVGGAAAAGSVLWQARKRGREDRLLLPPVPKREMSEATTSYRPYPLAPVLPAAAAGDGGGVATGRWFTPPMPEGLVTSCEERLGTLSLTRSPATASPWAPSSDATTTRRAIPVERDLISKLQVPKVIKPRPARPLRTTICIDSSSIVAGGGGAAAYPAPALVVSKKTEREVEAEMELPGALPAIVSGHRNRVYLANDAYKAMVGQPVCPWLDSVPGAGVSRRINGVVVLDVRRFRPAASSMKNAGGAGFPCTARISWEIDGGDAIASLTVPCAVEHLTGKSGDYCFIWRFDSSRASLTYCIM